MDPIGEGIKGFLEGAGIGCIGGVLLFAYERFHERRLEIIEAESRLEQSKRVSTYKPERWGFSDGRPNELRMPHWVMKAFWWYWEHLPLPPEDDILFDDDELHVICGGPGGAPTGAQTSKGVAAARASEPPTETQP